MSTGPIQLAPSASHVIQLPALPDDLPPAAPLIVVFEGQLGAEAGAIAGRRVLLGPWVGQLAHGPECGFTGQGFFFLRAGLTQMGLASSKFLAFCGGTSGDEPLALYQVLYRDPGVLPGNTLDVTVESLGCVFSGSGIFGPRSEGGTAAEIVEFVEPDSLGTLFGFTFTPGPALRRILASFSGAVGETFGGGPPISQTLDATGVRFLGVRLTNLDPFELPPDSGCQAVVTLNFVP